MFTTDYDRKTTPGRTPRDFAKSYIQDIFDHFFKMKHVTNWVTPVKVTFWVKNDDGFYILEMKNFNWMESQRSFWKGFQQLSPRQLKRLYQIDIQYGYELAELSVTAS